MLELWAPLIPPLIPPSAEERAFNHGSDCMAGWSPTAEHLEARNDAGDCESVQAWRAKVGDARVCEGSHEDVEVDDWDAGTVEISDSLSAIDYERYGKQIARPKALRGELEIAKEMRWAVQRETLNRRSSL